MRLSLVVFLLAFGLGYSAQAKENIACAEYKHADIRVEKGVLCVPRLIYFETGGDKILVESYTTFFEIAQFLRDHPEIRKVAIEVHGDNTVAKKRNLELTKKRARAALAYLVVIGKVDSARLAATGYGATRPVASNKVEAGRCRNRRLELRIIDPPLT